MEFNNKLLKSKIAKFSFGDNSFLDDVIIKGGYRVVRTVKERNEIDCCHRKLGMKVMVMGQDYSYKEYILKGENLCSNDDWFFNDSPDIEIGAINDSDVTLIDNYDDLDINQNIQTQQDLNNVLSNILKNLVNNNVVGDKHYTHDQISPSTIWYINHNLNKNPAIEIIDTAGSVIKTKIQYINKNSATSTSNSPFNGKAECN